MKDGRHLGMSYRDRDRDGSREMKKEKKKREVGILLPAASILGKIEELMKIIIWWYGRFDHAKAVMQIGFDWPIKFAFGNE